MAIREYRGITPADLQVLTMATKSECTERCRSCVWAGKVPYLSWISCDYILRTGSSRGCPAGDGCIHYKKRKGAHDYKPSPAPIAGPPRTSSEVRGNLRRQRVALGLTCLDVCRALGRNEKWYSQMEVDGYPVRWDLLAQLGFREGYEPTVADVANGVRKKIADPWLIRTQRILKGLSLEMVAFLAGTSDWTVREWEKGTLPPKWDKLEKAGIVKEFPITTKVAEYFPKEDA